MEMMSVVLIVLASHLRKRQGGVDTALLKTYSALPLAKLSMPQDHGRGTGGRQSRGV